MYNIHVHVGIWERIHRNLYNITHTHLGFSNSSFFAILNSVIFTLLLFMYIEYHVHVLQAF